MIPASRVLIVRPDTLGDIVLFSSLLRRLRKGLPQARLTVILRQEFLSLAPCLADDIDWLPLSFNPFRDSPNACRQAFEELLTQLRQRAPEVLLAPARRRTWLEESIARELDGVRYLSCGAEEADPFFQLHLKSGGQIKSAQRLSVPPDLPDWKAAHVLADALKIPGSAEPPQLTPSAEAQAEADTVLTHLKLQTGGYVVCAAAGFANVPLKTWPAERFAACLQALWTRHQLPGLLIGSTSERGYLEALAAKAAPAPVSIWTGNPEELPLLAALLSKARLFLGNDTGAVHLAEALGVPGSAVFGGGTWPRFKPACDGIQAVLHPLPCFGCGWDCPFGEKAPCIQLVTTETMLESLEQALAGGRTESQVLGRQSAASPAAPPTPQSSATSPSPALPAGTTPPPPATSPSGTAFKRGLRLLTGGLIPEAALGQAQKLLLALRQELESKQDEIRRLTLATSELMAEAEALRATCGQREKELDGKDAEMQSLLATNREREGQLLTKQQEIDALLKACEERLQLINQLDAYHREARTRAEAAEARFLAQAEELKAARAHEEETVAFYQRLSPDASRWAGRTAELEQEVARLERLLREDRSRSAELDRELREKSQSLANVAAGLGSLEACKHFNAQLVQKEQVLQQLNQACREREQLLQRLGDASFPALAWHRRLRVLIQAWWQTRVGTPLQNRFSAWVRRDNPWELGELHQHAPTVLRWERLSGNPGKHPLRIGLVTPSYNQARFLARTLESVLGQKYPNLRYVVQDGGSTDESPALIRARAGELHAWESVRDAGQADAIRKGFARLEGELGPEDLMGWLNSDDLLAPGALAHVASYFQQHPDVDAVYGHRFIIDPEDREIGRWVLPPHDPEDLRWQDFVPQETLFWRKRAWDLVGGLDPDFHFALDWDFLVRLQLAGLRIVRLPRFLGAFRVHAESKTHALIGTRGQQEMERVLRRLHNGLPDHADRHARVQRAKDRSALCAKFLRYGLRY